MKNFKNVRMSYFLMSREERFTKLDKRASYLRWTILCLMLVFAVFTLFSSSVALTPLGTQVTIILRDILVAFIFILVLMQMATTMFLASDYRGLLAVVKEYEINKAEEYKKSEIAG